MKNCLYVLKNELTGRYYIGSTNNIDRRMKQHIEGKVISTNRLKTFTLVYTEEFDTIQEARQRERKLKSYKSKKYIEWLISN